MLQPRQLLCRTITSFKFPRSSHRTYAVVVESSQSSLLQPALSVQDVPQPAHSRTSSKDVGSFMKTYKPKTPGLRHLRRPKNEHLWKGKPLKSLTYPKKGQSRGGRNNTGRVTVRHRGGGHKRRIRIIDYYRRSPGSQTVERIEYDPNRSAHIALVTHDVSKKQSYIIAADGLRAGDKVQSFRAGIPKDIIDSMGGTVDPGVLASKTAFRGNCLPIHMIPLGSQVHNVGSTLNRGAVFCRSAGTYATIITKNEKNEKIVDVTVRLQSGELRRVAAEACATIGIASNINHHFSQLGKAGRSRWLGIRPTVRGLAMNACDHPHGGGRGKSKGNVHSCSPWGIIAKSGFKTRRKRNAHTFLVQDRERNQGKRRGTKA